MTLSITTYMGVAYNRVSNHFKKKDSELSMVGLALFRRSPTFKTKMISITANMEKKAYETPATDVFEVKAQCVICGSERGLTETYTLGSTYNDEDFE